MVKSRDIVPVQSVQPDEADAAAQARETIDSDTSQFQLDSYDKPGRFDPYRALGVTRETPPPKIRTAYFDLLKKWHPDKFGNRPDEYKLAEQVAKALNAAWELLSNGKPYEGGSEEYSEYEFTLRDVLSMIDRVPSYDMEGLAELGEQTISGIEVASLGTFRQKMIRAVMFDVIHRFRTPGANPNKFGDEIHVFGVFSLFSMHRQPSREPHDLESFSKFCARSFPGVGTLGEMIKQAQGETRNYAGIELGNSKNFLSVVQNKILQLVDLEIAKDLRRTTRGFIRVYSAEELPHFILSISRLAEVEFSGLGKVRDMPWFDYAAAEPLHETVQMTRGFEKIMLLGEVQIPEAIAQSWARRFRFELPPTTGTSRAMHEIPHYRDMVEHAVWGRVHNTLYPWVHSPNPRLSRLLEPITRRSRLAAVKKFGETEVKGMGLVSEMEKYKKLLAEFEQRR